MTPVFPSCLESASLADKLNRLLSLLKYDLDICPSMFINIYLFLLIGVLSYVYFT